jgi:hypothetical protein
MANKKVLIIGFFDETFMPFMKEYEKVLESENCSYDKLYFDRNHNGKPLSEGNSYIFRIELSKGVCTNSFQKLLPYYLYRKYVINLIKKNNYEKLIVLTTTPAVLLGKLLMSKYKGKYIFDYRDKTKCERFSFYRKYVNKIVSQSFASFVSSEGFLDYYIDRSKKVHITHNISNIDSAKDDCVTLSFPINIGFVGAVRYYNVNTKLISAFANSKDFKLTYSGIMHDDCDLKGFCETNNIDNVSFTGPYKNSDKPLLYKNILLINALYDLESPDTLRAIPNKIYDAALFKIPILVTKGTYLAEVVEKYGLGCSIDINNEDETAVRNDILNYINSFDKDAFMLGCREFLDKVYKDLKEYNEVVKNFIIKSDM